MSLGEFDLISRYFKQGASSSTAHHVAVGIGDDCAILEMPDGHQLAVTTDTLVSGVHFFADVCPYRLGYKSLAVNLSDLAAMGAEPKWVSLAITLPEVDAQWLGEFSRGFFDLAKQYNVQLIGGDTTKGPLSITVSAKGIVPRQQALLRSAAKAGDLLCVSGDLGDGAVGLAHKLDALPLQDATHFVDALELTQPRNTLGQLLRGHASSCIDISDGLTQDLQHILKASACGAHIELQDLPLSAALQAEISSQHITHQQALRYALTGGDDYELLFTLSESDYVKVCNANTEDKITVIGRINDARQDGVQLTLAGQPITISTAGWDHFK